VSCGVFDEFAPPARSGPGHPRERGGAKTDLARLNLTVAPFAGGGASHTIHWDQPAHVIDAVRSMVAAAQE